MRGKVLALVARRNSRHLLFSGTSDLETLSIFVDESDSVSPVGSDLH